MSSISKLKKEGIEVVEELDTLTVNTISINVASKLTLAFPEHNLSKSDLFESLSRLNMYKAKLSKDSSGAKYFYKENSIYFNENLDIDEMSVVAVHECIHFIQELRDSNNNLTKMGLYTPSTNKGLAINEAAVQLMASEANMSENTNETYYGIVLNTVSPNYYPLECALLNQIAYFTGTYPLYHSTLNSNDIFKNTFVLKTDNKVYSKIEKNFDKLLSLENSINYFTNELRYTDKINTISVINGFINETKEEIKTLFFKTQNLIMSKFFKNEYNSIRNLEDIKNFTSKLYNYKNLIGTSDEYTFYNEFYRDMMNFVEDKKEYIEQNGEFNLLEDSNNSLMLVETSKNAFYFVKTFFMKLKKLIGINVAERQDINDI